MKMKNFKNFLVCTLCIVLIAAMALFATGCNKNTESSMPESSYSEENLKTMGEGKTQFIFTVTDFEGVETAFKINTDKKTVGDALQELGLIEGEEGQFGLYVKKVNGIEADYDKHGKYWAFYENGKQSAEGVSLTEITGGATYSFKVE